MNLKRTVLIIASTAVASLAIAGPASAATELGSRCAAAAGAPTALATNPTSQSFVIPSNGVITRWGFNFIPVPMPFPVSLAILRGSGVDWTLTGSSGVIQSAPGDVSSATRISVVAGDRIGIADTIMYCAVPGEEMQFGAFATGTPVGTAVPLTSNAPGAMPSVWATLEADVDLDGFGDETQDLCPQSAAFQIACPIPVLAVFRLKSANSFRALVTTAIDTTVVADGSVKLPAAKGKKAKTLKFKSKKLNTKPGKLTTINLKWPRSLTKALRSLSARSTLKVSVKITADGILEDKSRSFTTRLKGRDQR